MPRLLVSQATATHVEISGRRVLSFGGCNYLGLAHHPAVHAAMIDALAQFGLSTSASRETTGNTTAHDRLETSLASFLGMPAGVVVPDGYTANLAITQALVNTHAVALIDERSHKSIREAVKCAGMVLVEYAHLDAGHAADLMRQYEQRGVVVITDGVFTSDGALAPAAELLEALPPGAILVIDDCHGFCTIGPGGRGTHAHYSLADPRLVLTTTLAKGLGCHGGVVAGTPEVCDRVRSRASAYICTTPVSPAIAAAACEAVAIVQREPQRVERLWSNVARLGAGLRRLGLEHESTHTPIFAFTLESEQRMRRLAAEMLAEGILAPLISYPGGPSSCYFRLSVTSEHTPEQIDLLLTELGKRLEAAAPTRIAV